MPEFAHSEIVFMDATEMAWKIRSRQLSAVEVMEAHLAQIEAIDPKVNAVPTLVPELAMDGARAADKALATGDTVGPLHGLPVGIKDLTPTKGIRTTWGSPIYRDFVPSQDALIVTRLKDAGAIVIGKTNTPEFGAGSQTFNPVFGATLNPYDTSKTCGGSSGGAAVALACGMMPIAQGSDLGGSLRNPAAWNNVAGIRTSVGRVPNWPAQLGWNSLSVSGPMGRKVRDVALQLMVMAGPDPRVPVSLGEPGSAFARPLEKDFKGTRIAWSKDLGGWPVDAVITDVLQAQHHVFEDLGCDVTEAEPDLSDAEEIFRTWRAYSFAQQHERHLSEHRDLLKQTVVWNTEEGLRLTALDVAKAEEKRTRLWHRVVDFFGEYDYLCLPVTSVPPFSIDLEYPETVAGRKMSNYLEWMWPCYLITATGCPAVSVPAGFTSDGLPVGLQIVGMPFDDFGVLQIAHAFEQAANFGERRPPVIS